MLTKPRRLVKHEALFYSVFEVINLLQKDLLRMDLRVDDGELSKLHLGILGTLRGDRELSVSALAARMHVVKPQMTLLLDRLEGLGMVTRRPSTQDRRCSKVALTDSGERALASALARMDLALSSTLAVLDPAELEELHANLASLAGILRKLS